MNNSNQSGKDQARSGLGRRAMLAAGTALASYVSIRERLRRSASKPPAPLPMNNHRWSRHCPRHFWRAR